MDSDPPNALLDRARGGDAGALSELFAAHSPRLVRMVELRLDARLRKRLDPADVVQDAWIEVARRFMEWSVRATPPFHVWLRLSTSQALAQAQRRHLGTHLRDALREAALESRPCISAQSAADAFVASATSPSQGAYREELRARVLAALGELDEFDREIVALRHFEGLSNEDAALELGIAPAAASKRFVRALLRLRPALEGLRPGASTEGA
jgi:RNA polymerase sigma-70 factor (ECF subfamily)